MSTVDELRELVYLWEGVDVTGGDTVGRAADELDAKDAEIKRLREALQALMDAWPGIDTSIWGRTEAFKLAHDCLARPSDDGDAR